MADLGVTENEVFENYSTVEPTTYPESSLRGGGRPRLPAYFYQGRDGTKKRGNIPRTEKAFYKHRRFINDYHLRCDLEQKLLQATLALPNEAGIDATRVAQLRITLDRVDCSLPGSDKEWEEDDLARLHAIVKLIEVRHNVGVEEESTLDQWKALEVDRVFDRDTDKRKRDPVLKELAKRGDGDWLKRLDKHTAYRDSMQRLFESTRNLPKGERTSEVTKSFTYLIRTNCALVISHGGLNPSIIPGLSIVFDGHHDRSDAIEAWWQRRNALIFILRARVKQKVQGDPEPFGTWEGYQLPDPDSPTLKELCVEETGNPAQVETLGLGTLPTVRESGALYAMHEHELSPMPEGLIDLAALSE